PSATSWGARCGGRRAGSPPERGTRVRLWSLHPQHLDRQGLTACWREALLAQAVLAGVAEEAARRGYRFDRERIRIPAAPAGQLTVTEGQLALEWRHLLDKLATRSPDDAARQRDTAPRAHPLFRVVPGPVAPWERADG